jgi:signal transduction histidine kinase
MSKDFLRRLPLFADLSEEDLDQLYQMAELVSIQAGELLMVEGDPGDALYIVLDGMFEVSKRSGQQEVVIAACKPGEVLGEMSLLDQAPRSASVRALTNSQLLKISQATFERLLAWSSSAALSILHTVTARLRNTEAMLRQSEKMAALGTLAAGLAHELNNPAAAARRSAAQLGEGLTEWQRLTVELDTLDLDPHQTETVNVLRGEIVRRVASPTSLDPLTRSDRESEVQTWLEDRGLEEVWDLAPTLVTFGWDLNALEKLADDFSDAQLPVVVQWLGTGGSIYALLDEVGKSAERISEIVKAVKTYSYLDQAPIQEVNVHDGLENTLVILRHKLTPGVNVTRDYAADLPRIEAYASELNQVWTNIIDNAIDAMQGQGELVVRTYPTDSHVAVEICDNGPGIPPEIQSRIFDPFFTTKPPGIGTGLGLHIAYNIVVQKHHGQIRVTSKPGATCFQVTLPVELQ